MATKMTSREKMKMACDKVINQYFVGIKEDTIGQTGPFSFDMLVPMDGDEEIFVTVKVQAHNFMSTEKTDPYDGFVAAQEYQEEVTAKQEKAAARAKEKERKEKEKASRAASRRKKSNPVDAVDGE